MFGKQYSYFESNVLLEKKRKARLENNSSSVHILEAWLVKQRMLVFYLHECFSKQCACSLFKRRCSLASFIKHMILPRSCCDLLSVIGHCFMYTLSINRNILSSTHNKRTAHDLFAKFGVVVSVLPAWTGCKNTKLSKLKI